MNTSIPNISKPYLLDEFLSSSDFIVKLFTNNIIGNEDPIIFSEPMFSGYSQTSLLSNNWNVSVLDVNYATCDYKTAVVFNNLGESQTEPILGYYVTNQNGENLWYEKFSSPKIIGIEEGIAIKIKVNLNRPGAGFGFVSLVLNSSTPEIPISSSTISFISQTWNGNLVPGSLIDITNKNFYSNSSVFTMLLTPDIIPSYDYPYEFSVLIESDGFDDLVYSGSISNSGLVSFGVTLNAIFPPPVPTPEPPANNGDLIELYGPFDTKSGVTFKSASDESKFSFYYMNNANLSLPEDMKIFINSVQFATVNYFSSYIGEQFIFQYEEYILSGVFSSGNVFLNVPPPGPQLPPPG